MYCGGLKGQKLTDFKGLLRMGSWTHPEFPLKKQLKKIIFQFQFQFDFL